MLIEVVEEGAERELNMQTEEQEHQAHGARHE